MERPTCKTCPYYLIQSGEQGTCQFGTPDNLYAPGRMGAWIWPPTRPDEFCHAHPDFPAYIASLKPPSINNDLSQHEKLRDMLKSASPEELDQILKILSKREQEVIKLSFGLSPHVDSYDHSHVARIFKITRERARHIEDKAIKILMAKWIRSESHHSDRSEPHQT